MLTLEEALRNVHQSMDPVRLNTIQELVFCRSWEGFSYQEIAEEVGYDADYVRVVGARLWKTLSNVLGERITKSNFQVILKQQYVQPALLSNSSQTNSLQVQPTSAHATLQLQQETSLTIEAPEGPVPLGSHFYIERPFVDEFAITEITRNGALVRIRGPQRWGKTSLLNRVLAKVQSIGYKYVRLNFHQADHAVLSDIDSLLRWFCANVAFQLQMDPKIDDFWDEYLGTKTSCTNYLQSYILENVETAIAIALDDIHVIFEYPEVAKEFLPLLRLWHEEANNLSLWGKLRIIVAHSTEIYVPLNLKQSPFNVGIPIKLSPFTLEQVKTLVDRHQLSRHNQTVSIDCLKPLQTLVNGHPYLIRSALFTLVQGGKSCEQLMKAASTSSGVFAGHLQRLLTLLQQQPKLAEAFKAVIQAESPMSIDTISAYKLQSLGLVNLIEDKSLPSCPLYQQYFQNRVDDF